METQNTDIRDHVRETYGRIAREKPGNCCCSGCGGSADLGRTPEQLGYSPDDIAAIPRDADAGLSCGNPFEFAAISTGETIIDLGAGPGKDCFIAARLTGPSGRVIGIDMTGDMLKLAEQNNADFKLKTGLTNVEFHEGYIEELPLPEGIADAIISNCVINLSPDKEKVFREAVRVLRPGGRLITSDIVLTEPLPDELKSDMDLYSACLSGALVKDDYISAIRAAGFSTIEILRETGYGDGEISCADASDINRYASSITVRAFKDA